MKKSVVGVIVFSILFTGVNAFDLGDVTKGLEKTLEAGRDAGVVKGGKPIDIMTDNVNDKKNIEACKKFYHQHKIAFNTDNGIPDYSSSKDWSFTRTYDKKDVEAWNKAYDNAIDKLQKSDFDIAKHTKKNNLNAQAMCRFILSSISYGGEKRKAFKGKDFDALQKETAKYYDKSKARKEALDF